MQNLQLKNQAEHFAFYQKNIIRTYLMAFLKTKTLDLKFYSDFPETYSILVVCKTLEEFQMKSKCFHATLILFQTYKQNVLKIKLYLIIIKLTAVLGHWKSSYKKTIVFYQFALWIFIYIGIQPREKIILTLFLFPFLALLSWSWTNVRLLRCII